MNNKYTTFCSCPECSKLIINSGITRVVYENGEPMEPNWLEESTLVKVEKICSI